MAFRGNVALITGAGSGMGQLAAKNLANAGASVAALDVNEAGLAETRAAAPSIRTFPCDVTSYAAVDDVIARVERELGAIDRVMNAAGVMPVGQLLDQTAEQVNRVMAINYCGTVNVTQRTLPAMLARGRGDLVQFGSLAGWMPTLRFGAYDASKFAVVAYSEVLYHENRKRGVRITCVCPPAVATPMFEKMKDGAKSTKFSPVIAPQAVLDAIERSLEKGELWCFPRFAAITLWTRRLIPNAAWWFNHRVEGTP